MVRNVGVASGNPAYDWNFVTQPQIAFGGRSVELARGKLLGGSSGLNYMLWNRGPRTEYDAWESFAPGNGWNWEGILPFFKRSTNTFTPQSDPFGFNNTQEDFDPNDDGTGGPVQASFNTFYPDPVPVYVKTLNDMGVLTNSDPVSGMDLLNAMLSKQHDRITVTTQACLTPEQVWTASPALGLMLLLHTTVWLLHGKTTML
ncbi:hypothetical protein H0H81_008686 [Sphagnurus paluster]|uniref:Glucose-methanol-choline oxidoreductase N-terminal domain-containing protein n=1 Tax=Sphagnurus paluster TaxID=117069 RepID=A0A9P7G196_9AGAR|nr:hypothetical protein H0H81_008686 [Sphagnurus paluster]